MNFLDRLQSILCEEYTPRTVRDDLEARNEEIARLEDSVDQLQQKNDQLQQANRQLEADLASARGEDAPDVDTKRVELSFVADALRTIDDFDSVDIWRPMNKKYVVPTRDSFEQVIEWDATDAKEYERDYFDCVDFTYVIRSLFSRKYRINGLGTVITYAGTPHAFNVVVFADGTAELFEPQSDTFVTPGESSMYDITDGVIHV